MVEFQVLTELQELKDP
jgi:hypothetical protein